MVKHQYRIKERKRQTRLKQIEKGTHDLGGELALARLLAEEALQAGNIGQCGALLEVARRLSIDDVERQIRERDLMPRDEALRIANQMGAAMFDILREHLPDDQAGGIMDAWCDRVRQLTTPQIEDQR